MFHLLSTVFSPGLGQFGVLKTRQEGVCLEILLGGGPAALWDLQSWKPEPYLQHSSDELRGRQEIGCQC